MKKLLLLLLLSPLVIADDEVVTDLINKTWIESSASDMTSAKHVYRFFEDRSFFAVSESTNGDGGFVWNGAYEMRKNNYFSIYSDELECVYQVSKIGSFYRLENIKRNFTNICPDLLVKESLTDLK